MAALRPFHRPVACETIIALSCKKLSVSVDVFLLVDIDMLYLLNKSYDQCFEHTLPVDLKSNGD